MNLVQVVNDVNDRLLSCGLKKILLLLFDEASTMILNFGSNLVLSNKSRNVHNNETPGPIFNVKQRKQNLFA